MRFYIMKYGCDPYEKVHEDTLIDEVSIETSLSQLIYNRRAWAAARDKTYIHLVMYIVHNDNTTSIVGIDEWSNFKPKPRVINPPVDNSAETNDNIPQSVSKPSTQAEATVPISYNFPPYFWAHTLPAPF